MAEDKPLHVRVAEALGCLVLTKADSAMRYRCGCDDGEHQGTTWDAVLRYDTEWSATGPLIERYSFHVQPMPPTFTAQPWGAFLAHIDGASSVVGDGYGPTPLIAVCNLILALHEAGKLGR